MVPLREQALALAQFPNDPALIIGEPGTGRRSLARLIHSTSVRRNGAVIEFRATGLPGPVLYSELFGHFRGAFKGAYREKRGLVWRAHGGCVIAADLDQWAREGQTGLYAFVRTAKVRPIGASEAIGSVDARLIATVESAASLPRESDPPYLGDLFRQPPLIIPPLRDRGDDIIELCERVARSAGADAALDLTPDAEALLLSHAWPGNFPELRAVAMRLARQRTATITAAAVARALASGRSLPRTTAPVD
jgi:DNA-binding NtrC family response regulator